MFKLKSIPQHDASNELDTYSQHNYAIDFVSLRFPAYQASQTKSIVSVYKSTLRIAAYDASRES